MSVHDEIVNRMIARGVNPKDRTATFWPQKEIEKNDTQGWVDHLKELEDFINLSISKGASNVQFVYLEDIAASHKTSAIGCRVHIKEADWKP